MDAALHSQQSCCASCTKRYIIQSRMLFKIHEISKHVSKQATNKTSITPIPHPPIPIPSIKHQSPHLNTLPRLLILLTLIHKRRMRHPARHPRLVNRVKALYQRHLIRPLRVLEIPPMPLVRPDRKRLPAPVGVDEPDPDQIRLGDRVRVGDGERVFEDCFDGAPDLLLLASLRGVLERGRTLMIWNRFCNSASASSGRWCATRPMEAV